MKNTLDDLEKIAIDALRDQFGETYRLQIFAGKMSVGVSIKGPPPDSTEELVAALKDLIGFLEAPSIPDPDVLGEFSPKPIPSDEGCLVDNTVPNETLTNALIENGKEQTKRTAGLF